MGEVLLRGVLAVGHVGGDVHDDGIFKRDGKIMFHRPGGGSPVEFHFHLGQTLAGGQRAEKQGGRLVDDLGDLERLVHALPGRLTGLRIAGQHDGMAERLDKAFVLVAFLINVADGSLGEVAGGDEALMFSGDGKVCGYGHDTVLLAIRGCLKNVSRVRRHHPACRLLRAARVCVLPLEPLYIRQQLCQKCR